MPLALFEENFSEGDSPVYLHILFHILFPRQRPVISTWFHDAVAERTLTDWFCALCCRSLG
jgi:hypothetical protein